MSRGAMANDALMPRFLYTMLKQLDLRGIDWNEISRELNITNGHAARMRYSRFKLQMEGKASTPRKPRAPRDPKDKSSRSGAGRGKGKSKNGKHEASLEDDKSSVKLEDGSLSTPLPDALLANQMDMGSPAVSEADKMRSHAMMSGGASNGAEPDVPSGSAPGLVIKNEPREEDALGIVSPSAFPLASHNDSQATDASYELDTAPGLMDLHSPHLSHDPRLNHSHVDSPLLASHSFPQSRQENMMSFSSAPAHAMYADMNPSSASEYRGLDVMGEMGDMQSQQAHHGHGHAGVERPDFGAYLNVFDGVIGGVYGGDMLGTGTGMIDPAAGQRGMVKMETQQHLWDRI